MLTVYLVVQLQSFLHNRNGFSKWINLRDEALDQKYRSQ